MKWFLIAAIFLCLVGVMACEDIVTGDYPISRIGDTVYIFPQVDDSYIVYLTDDHCSIDVYRPYDEGTTIRFEEWFNDQILTVQIIKQPGSDQ